MKKFLYFVLGTVWLVIGIRGIVVGELPGIGANVSSARTITYSGDPVEYIVSALILLGLGGVCIWAVFFED